MHGQAAQVEQALRLTYRRLLVGGRDPAGLVAARRELAADGRLRIEAVGRRATDLIEYDGCLERRFRLTRTWDLDGPTAAWVGFNPITGDLEGDPDDAPRRVALRNVATIASNHLGRLGRLVVVNLFVRRSRDIAADVTDRFDDGGVRAAAREADVVMAAWGARAGHGQLDRIRRVVSLVEQEGRALHAPAVDGHVRLTARWPRQPRHPVRARTRGVTLRPLPAGWAETFDAPAREG